jgi:hypothetical protein
MTLSISGTPSVQQADTPAPVRAVTRQAPPPQPPTDTVTLSQSAQVNQLKTQGLRPSQIADALEIPVATVNSDLGIVAAIVASQPAAVSATTTPAPTSTKSTPAA